MCLGMGGWNREIDVLRDGQLDEGNMRFGDRRLDERKRFVRG